MIIKNPQGNVVGFQRVRWLLRDETASEEEIGQFLRDAVGTDEETPEKDEEDDNYGVDVNPDGYTRFSFSEDGDVLLRCEDADDEEDLLLTGEEAKAIFPKLKGGLEGRMQKLRKFLQGERS